MRNGNMDLNGSIWRDLDCLKISLKIVQLFSKKMQKWKKKMKCFFWNKVKVLKNQIKYNK